MRFILYFNKLNFGVCLYLICVLTQCYEGDEV